MTSDLGRPYIYFLLYNRTDPDEYVRTRKAERDWYGLWNVYGFGKYDFTEQPPLPGERVLTVKRGVNSVTHKIDQVVDSSGNIIFEIGEN